MNRTLEKSAFEIDQVLRTLATASSPKEFSIVWVSPELFEKVLRWGLKDLPKIVKYQILDIGKF